MSEQNATIVEPPGLGKVLVVPAILVLLLLARLLTQWQHHCTHDSVNPTTQDTELVEAKAQFIQTQDLHLPSSLRAPAPGLSVTASVDPDANIQLYDLDSSGNLHVRKRTNSSDPKNTKWSTPEIIPTDPKPKRSSPLAAIAFQFKQGVTELRIYYVDSSNRIVEFESSFSSSGSSAWTRGYSSDATSTGGIAAIWLGDESIRLYTIQDKHIAEIVWYKGDWGSPHSLGLSTLATSALSATIFRDSDGEFRGIFLQYVNARLELVEGAYDPEVDPNNFRQGRTIDDDFSDYDLNADFTLFISQNTNNAYQWHSQYIDPYSGLTERSVDNPFTEYDIHWQTVGDSPKPDVSGGAVAAVAWELHARVFYVSGGAIVEEALYEGSWSSLCKVV